MAETTRCEACDRTFKDSGGLMAHNKSKHPALVPRERKPLPMRKIRNWGIFIAILVVIVWGVMALMPESNVKKLNVNIDGNAVNIPAGAVHWHPRLTIKIDGKARQISQNIGITTGKIIDAQLSGMRMSPVHTHEPDGTIHLENSNPSRKPESLTLGYFFYVWDKQFSSSCIFEYCINEGELKMFVNGQQNDQFENYIMQDKDDILIEYTSTVK